MKLFSVFSSGALFQADDRSEIRGKGEPLSYFYLSLLLGSEEIYSSSAVSDEDGYFALELQTPTASFDEYDIIVSDENEKYRISSVLFGELFLCSGQSNMDMPNVFHRGKEKLYERLKGKKIRIYAQDLFGGRGGNGDYPICKDYGLTGEWITADDVTALDNVSALATAAVADIYDHINKDADIPVGFVNSSVGGSGITTWLPRDLYDSELDGYSVFTREDTWNTHGTENYNQYGALFNLKIAPLMGMKFKAIMWYQGEHDAGREDAREFYKDALMLYRKIYEKLFGAEDMKLIAAQLYAYRLSKFRKLCLGIADASMADENISVVPTYDLSYSWTPAMMNFPYHPTHKYELGKRFASVANAVLYGSGENMSSPVAAEIVKCDGGIKIRFAFVKDDISVDNSYGAYVASENGIFCEADVKAVSPDTVLLSSDSVKKPVYAAYKYDPMATGGGIYSGKMPVSAFYFGPKDPVLIQRPWLHHELLSVPVQEAHPSDMDVYQRPVYRPLGKSEVCIDKDFRDGEYLIRVRAVGDDFGVYVRSYIGYELDLYRFKHLIFEFVAVKSITPVLYAIINGKTVDIELTKVNDTDHDSAEYRADLTVVSAEADRLVFCGRESGDAHFVKTFALGKMRLVPRDELI